MKTTITQNLSIFGLCLAILLSPGCEDEDSPQDPPGDNEDDIPGYREGVGSSANELLSDKEFEHLVMELQFVVGNKPKEESLDNFESFLENRLNKPGGIEVKEGKVISENSNEVKSEYSTSDIRNLEDEFRTEFSREDTITAYMVFLNGNSERDDDNARILGLAYNNTSTAIFSETIEDISGDGVTQPRRERVEITVINHEMGHIMGLVDNGTPMQTDHKDEGRGAHCEVDDCLMYYTMKRDDLVEILLDSSNPELGEYCLEDLRANGGK